jgi:hypothetical protein
MRRDYLWYTSLTFNLIYANQKKILISAILSPFLSFGFAVRPGELTLDRPLRVETFKLGTFIHSGFVSTYFSKSVEATFYCKRS